MGAMRVENLRPAVTIDFAPGDVLVLLSDGVYEYADAGGAPFGRARVEQFLRDQRSQPTAVLAARLLDSVKAFAGGAPQQDDVTMVLVKRLGESHGGAFSEAK